MRVAFFISFIGHSLFIGMLELTLCLFPSEKNVNYMTINFEMRESSRDATGGEKEIRRVEEKSIQPELKQQPKQEKKIVQNISRVRAEKKVSEINQKIEKSAILTNTVDKVQKDQNIEENLKLPKPDRQHKLEEIAPNDISKQTSKDNNGMINAGGKEKSLYREGTNQDIESTRSSGDGISLAKSGMAGSEKEAIARYQDIVRQRIERVKMYPLWAKKQGIEGSTLICFTISPDGTGQSVKVVRSSGSSILDEEAVATVKRANPFPPVPSKISRMLVRIELAIVFSLKKY